MNNEVAAAAGIVFQLLILLYALVLLRKIEDNTKRAAAWAEWLAKRMGGG